MALKLKGSTSGFVALDSPSVAGNNTLTLPENNGSAQQLLGNDITAGVVTFTSVTVNRNGDLTVPGTISIGGTLTYEDVTSVDSVGIVTARSGVRINGGGLTIIGDTTGLKASGISTFGGSVGIADSIIHTGDTDTSIRFPSADTITAETAGSERLRISSSGRVAIGNATNNASPTALFGVIADDGEADDLYVGKFHNLEATAGRSYGVNIQAGSSSNDHGFRVKNRANDTTQFLVRGDGVVCVGTDSPNTSASTLQTEHSGENNVYIVGNTSTSGARIILQNKNTTANSFTGVLGADAGGQTTADIKFYSADNDTNEGYLTLETRPASGTPTEAIRIDSSQRVMIGTTTEGNANADDLTIATGGTTGITVRSGSSNTGNIYFSDATSGSGEFAGAVEYSHSTNSLQLHSNSNEALRINNSRDAKFVGVVTATQFAATEISNGRKNLLINGAMKFNERVDTPGLGYYNPVTSSIYTLDRWKVMNGSSFDTDSAHIHQSTQAPTGFSNSMKWEIGNTETPSSSQNCGIEQKIEGQDLQHLAYGTSSAKTMTLSFWVRSNKLGTYNVHIMQEDGTKYQMHEYTIDSSNTWEKKTIRIVGNTANAINDDNTTGLRIIWVLTVGSGDIVSATSTWASGGDLAGTSNQVNLWDNGSNEWYLTGCQLEVGEVATAYDHRPTGEELALCQRYFFMATRVGSTSDVTNRPLCMGSAYSSSEIRAIIDFPQEMRALPSMTSNDNSNSYYFQRDSGADFFNSLTLYVTSEKRASVRNTTEISSTAGHAGLVSQENGNSRLSFEAEL